MLQIILLLLPGVFSENWTVTNHGSICGVRGTNVTISCNFTYPKNQQQEVTQASWCFITKHVRCDIEGPYLYNSSDTNKQSNFQFTGNNISDCSFLIWNINSSFSGVYLFRFITNVQDGRYTSNPGVNVTVTDLRVSMTGFNDNENITVGKSLNLTCTTVSCTAYLPQLQWFKNNELMQHSGPILTFRSLTTKDSGNYSCSLKNFKSSASEQVQLFVYATDIPESTSLFGILKHAGIAGVFLISIIFVVIAVILIKRRRAKPQEIPKDEVKTIQADTVPQTNLQRTTEVLQDEEVQYSSICIKPKELSASNKPQNEDSSIYSEVRVPEAH